MVTNFPHSTEIALRPKAQGRPEGPAADRAGFCGIYRIFSYPGGIPRDSLRRTAEWRKTGRRERIALARQNGLRLGAGAKKWLNPSGRRWAGARIGSPREGRGRVEAVPSPGTAVGRAGAAR